MSSDAQSPIGPAELRNIGLFGALSDDVLEYLSTLLTVETPPAGATLLPRARAILADVAALASLVDLADGDG